MKHLFFILTVMVLPLVNFAQDDDPFASPASDDPFASPAPSTPAPRTPQPHNDNPFDDNYRAVESTEETFDGQAAEDPFNESANADDPFGSPATSGVGNLPFGGGAASSDLLSNLTDTLVKPLRPDFPWEQKSIKERQVFDLYDVSEKDVFWAKTVWRELDVREKMNHPFVNPKAPFMTILLDIIKNDTTVKLYAYDPFVDAEFQDETTWEEINNTLGSTRTIEVPSMDAEGNITTSTQTITDKFNIGSVKKFRIKEVWYFDKVASRMKVAIMGIAPIKETSFTDLGVTDMSMDLGGAASEDPLFWIYYPDLREKLARYETFNPLNDAIRMSWDDLLQARFFSSYITKASNPLDKSVKDYTRDNLAALYESENIKEQIFNFEHDLWSY